MITLSYWMRMALFFKMESSFESIEGESRALRVVKACITRFISDDSSLNQGYQPMSRLHAACETPGNGSDYA